MLFEYIKTKNTPVFSPIYTRENFSKFFFSKNIKIYTLRGYFQNLILRNSLEYKRFSSTERSEYSFKESFSHYFCQVVALTHLLFYCEYFGKSVCRSLVF